MEISLILLAAAIIFAVIYSTLEKAGVMKIEDMPPSSMANALAIISLPLVLITEIGLIAIVAWSLFALPWMNALVVILIALFGFGWSWGVALAFIRRSSAFSTIVRAGVPITLSMRLITAACTVALAYRLAFL